MVTTETNLASHNFEVVRGTIRFRIIKDLIWAYHKEQHKIDVLQSMLCFKLQYFCKLTCSCASFLNFSPNNLVASSC